MSVTFFAARVNGDNRYRAVHDCGYKPGCMDCEKHEINITGVNARALIQWLELDGDNEDGEPFGQIEATELVAKCNRRLWDEPRNHDAAIPRSESGGPGTGQVKYIHPGRGAGYLRDRTEQLLAIAKLAGDHYVCWN